MKNTARILALVLAAVMICALFAACGANKPSGTYTLKTIDGKTVLERMKAAAEEEGASLEEFLDYYGYTEKDLENYMRMTFNDDGTGKVSILGVDDMTMTWKIDGKTLTVTANGTTETFEFNGNTITGTDDGELYVFSK